jgi:hypothetical protein
VRTLFLVALVAGIGCGGDLLNNQLIHTHVDDVLAHDPAEARPADLWALNAGVLVPIYGSYELDHRVFGSVRPSAIVFDWVLGGFAPAGLAAASFAVDDAHTQAGLRWGALALYGATRLAVLVVGNLHIDEYDSYLVHRSRAPKR